MYRGVGETATQAWRLEFKPQYPCKQCKRPEVVACICDPKARWKVREKWLEGHRLANVV